LLCLGIETSCDETAVAVVDANKKIYSNIVLSQIEQHQPYGGVVPEIAARAHLRYITQVYEAAMLESGFSLRDIDVVAATAGPGLIGGVIVGLMFAKGLALAAGKKFIGVNHLEGHALTPRLTGEVRFPYLLLLVSGGHCQFLLAKGVGDYVLLGKTMDDASGEAFDKVAKMLGMEYPGGPKVEVAAKLGNPLLHPLPLAMVGREGCDFSFSGIKTATRKIIDAGAAEADVCASFQYTVGRIFADRTRNAIFMAKSICPEFSTLVVAGGVAANTYLREILRNVAENNGVNFAAPPLALCTDNAAMIAWAGIESALIGRYDSLAMEPKARWPL